MKKIYKYILVSGGGWVLDFIIYMNLVIHLNIRDGFANFISATIAALSVFILTKSMVFDNRDQNHTAILNYYIYIELTIIIWSFVIDNISIYVYQYTIISSTDTSAAVAKIIVTPVSLLANYLTSYLLLKNGSNV